MSYTCVAKAMAVVGVFIIAKQGAAVSLGEASASSSSKCPIIYGKDVKQPPHFAHISGHSGKRVGSNEECRDRCYALSQCSSWATNRPEKYPGQGICWLNGNPIVKNHVTSSRNMGFKKCSGGGGGGGGGGGPLPTPTGTMSSVYANRNPTEGFGYKKKGGIGGCMHRGNGQWLKLDFRAVVSISKISSVRIMAHESPRSWKVEYSTNGHSWTKVGDFNGDGEKTVNAQARYVRAVVTRSSGTRADCLNLKVSGGSGGGPAGCKGGKHQGEHIGWKSGYGGNNGHGSLQAAINSCSGRCNAVMFYAPNGQYYVRNYHDPKGRHYGSRNDWWCQVK